MNVHQDVHYGITYNEAIGNKVLAINRQFIDTTRHGREKSRHVLLLSGGNGRYKLSIFSAGALKGPEKTESQYAEAES